MKIHQILINDSGKLPNKFPDFHNACKEQLLKLYPNSEYHLYSGDEIESILKENFEEDVYISYKRLKPYACRADLARLCLLYLYGGLYVDLNLYFLSRIEYLEHLNFLAFRDLPELSLQSWAVQNGIMYSEKGSSVTKNAINLIVKHCKTNYYGLQCVDVSATTVLGRAIVQSLPSDRIYTPGQLTSFSPESLPESLFDEIEKFGYNRFSGVMLGFVSNDNILIALRKPCGGGDIESMGFSGTNNYVKMWENRDVFFDEPKYSGTISNIIEYS